MRLLDLSRGHLIVEVDKKTVTIYGEGFIRGLSLSDFVLYSNSVDRWDAPNEDKGYP